LALAIASVGCATGVVPAPQHAPVLGIDRQALLSEMAHPATTDWSDSRLSSPELERLRLAPVSEARQKAMADTQRQLQALTNAYNASSTTFGGVAGAAGRVSSAPAYSFWTNEGYWLTESGWLLKRNMGNGAVTAFRINNAAPGDTFVNTSLTISNDGLRAYAVSTQGRFYAVRTSDGSHVMGSPFAMGGASASVPTSAAPFIDPLASRDDGQIETIYAVNHSGTLFRFYMHALHNAPANWTVSVPQSYTLPANSTAPYTELFRGAPVVIGGRLVIGTWRRHATDSFMDAGTLIYFNTGINGLPASATATGTGTLVRSVGLPSPVWCSPALEFDDFLNPTYAFVPTGYVVTMVELATGQQVQSVPLLAPATTPVSGTMSSLTYSGGVVATPVSVTPVANGTVTVTNNASRTVPTTNAATDPNLLVPTFIYDGSNNTPFWAYLKFMVTSAHVTVNNTARAIIDAKVRLRVNSPSNQNGNQNPDPVQIFRVGNTLSTGTTSWSSANVTPANRPAFESGSAFTHANLNSHSAVELDNYGQNSFSNNGTYDFGARGLVTAPNQEYSFGMAHTELPWANTAPNNGQPFKTSAPRFFGGTSPTLLLTLSTNGLTTPTMATPVTIDSLNNRIYAVNTNALYAISYAGTLFSDRVAAFSDSTRTYFSLTSLGRSGAAGPTASGAFVANVTAPLFTGTNIYVADHHPGANTATVNRFTPGLPPTLNADVVTLSGTTDGRRPSSYMAYDFIGSRLYLGTHNPDPAVTTNNGRAWVLFQ
jgi:hypothetical protein